MGATITIFIYFLFFCNNCLRERVPGLMYATARSTSWQQCRIFRNFRPTDIFIDLMGQRVMGDHSFVIQNSQKHITSNKSNVLPQKYKVLMQIEYQVLFIVNLYIYNFDSTK